MAEQTLGGLFKSQARGEQALKALHDANFPSAQISEVTDSEDQDPSPSGTGSSAGNFFKDHVSSASDFKQSLSQLGMSAADADYFEDGVARGEALVTVEAGSRASEALQILADHGADLGSAKGSAAALPATGSQRNPMAASHIEDEQKLQLRAERLAVDKTRVASGTVRISKQVISAKQDVDVAVMHEEIVIERRPVSGEAVSGTIGKSETISVPLSREEVKVAKETFVTEEVEIGKRAVAGTERVSETVSHEELIVDGDDGNTKPPAQ